MNEKIIKTFAMLFNIWFAALAVKLENGIQLIATIAGLYGAIVIMLTIIYIRQTLK